MSKRDFFDLPVSSGNFNIHISNGTLSDIKKFKLEQVKNKVFAMPINNKMVFAPLRHTT